MDRRTSAGNVSSGLATAAIAVVAFGLTFFVAILYIG